MNVKSIKSRIDFELVKQYIKWTVYVLLLVNFSFYLSEDANRASHTLAPGAHLGKWMHAFATSIDYLAWLVLILIYELDTYILDEQPFASALKQVMRLVRVCCYVFVLHTIIAYATAVYEHYFEVEVAQGVRTLCDLADTNKSFVSNLHYTDVTAENCDTLGTGNVYFIMDDGLVVTDRDNLQRERTLAWMDLTEVCSWFLIMILIELGIRAQDRGITEGPVIVAGNYLRPALYTLILGLGVHWALSGHALYLWDEMLWIGGFAAIEMNVADWREDLREEAEMA